MATILITNAVRVIVVALFVFIDYLITQYLGETVATSRHLSGAVRKLRGIRFLDDFDSV